MKKKMTFLIVYLAFAGAIIMTSSTLAKYLTTTNPNPEFVIGEKLYFNYERGDLFRNEQLIVGVVKDVIDENGELKRRIETMNVAPGDNLTYHFYVSNYNDETGETNGSVAEFFPQAGATLSMPMRGETYDIECTLLYREVSTDPNVLTESSLVMVTKDTSFELPTVSNDGTGKKKYEFQVNIVLDEQVKDTTSDDYFGATMLIYLFVDSASTVTAIEAKVN